MDYVKPDVIRYENGTDRDYALRFLRSHHLPMVRPLHHGEIEAWCECVKDGCEYVERYVFEPDLDGLIDFDEVRAWLGY